MIEKNLVLDTCALLWLVSGDPKLSKEAAKSIETAAAVYVSAISAWEISLKAARNELDLPMDAETWFNLSLEKHSLIQVPLDAAIAREANRLPFHHKDPADRFIIATAKILSASIVSADGHFIPYGLKLIS